MPLNQLSDLVAYLRRPSIRIRTGLWLVPSALVGKEAEEAARLGIDGVDLRQPVLEQLAPDQKFLGLRLEMVVQLLDTLSRQKAGNLSCLVYNLDLLLARLGYEEQHLFWQEMYDGLPHRHRVLILAMPQTAVHLLPPLPAWEQDSRLVGSKGP